MPSQLKKNIQIFSNNFIDDQEMPLQNSNFMACAYAELFKKHKRWMNKNMFLEIGHIVDEDLKINKNPELPSQESGMCFMSLKGYIWTWDKLCLALSGSIWCSKFELGSFIQSTQVHLSPFGYIKDVPDSFNDKSGFNCWIFITYQLPLQKGMQHVSSLFGSYGAGAEPGLIPPAEGGRTGPQIYVFPNVPLPVVCRQPVVLGKKRMMD